MADDVGQIAVAIVANDNTKAGLDSAANEVKDASLEMAAGLEEAKGKAEETGGVFDSLSEKLREHRAEHVQTARAVRSFTTELDGITGKGTELTGVLAGLAGGLAMGGPLGLGIEAVKEGTKAFSEWLENSKSAAEKLNEKRFEEIAQSITDAGNLAEESWKKFMGPNTPERQIEKLKSELHDLQNDLTKLAGPDHDILLSGRDLQRADDLKKKIEDVQVAMGKLEFLAQQDLFGKQAEDAEKAKKAADLLAEHERQINAQRVSEAERVGSALSAITQQWTKEGADKSTQVELEAAAAIKKIDDDLAQARAKHATGLTTLEAQAALAREQVEAGLQKKLEQLADEEDTKETARQNRAAEKRAQGVNKAINDFEHEASAEDDIWRKQHEAHAELYKKQEQEVKHYSDFASSAIQSAARSIILDHKSMSDVLNTLWQSLVEKVVSSLITMATESATEAVIEKVISVDKTATVVGTSAAAGGAATAASYAEDMPYPENLAAPAVGLAMAASIDAAFGGMAASAAASDGYDIPTGVNPITQLHQEEMVLPANIANPLRENLAGAGGGSITVNISAMDGASVTRVVESDAFTNAIREATRNGRL